MTNSGTLEEDHKDPFLPFGLGMIAYFSLLRRLLILFCIVTILFAPLIIMYECYDDALDNVPGLSAISSASMGSMGMATFVCDSQQLFMKQKELHLQCRDGLLQMPTHVGLLPFNNDVDMAYSMDYCGAPAKH